MPDASGGAVHVIFEKCIVSKERVKRGRIVDQVVNRHLPNGGRQIQQRCQCLSCDLVAERDPANFPDAIGITSREWIERDFANR